MAVLNVSTTGDPAQGPVTEQAIWIPFVEPVPDWDEADKTYGIWWPIHVYLVAALFILVAGYSIINMIYLCILYGKGGFKNVQQIAYFIAISALMLVFSVERAVFMIYDAYNVKASFHPALAYLFISVGLPCMTSCFFLIFHAFYKATRSRLAGKSIFTIKALVAVIVIHFAFSITLDIAAGFNIHPEYLLVICQSLFVVCGFTFCIMFFVIFRRMYRKSVTRRRRMIRIASGMNQLPEKPAPDGNESGENEKPGLKRTQDSMMSMPQPKVTLGGKLILASAILLLLVVGLYLYGIFGIYIKHAMTGEKIDLWLWWAWEFAVRILEVSLCWTISLAGTQPMMKGFRKLRTTRRHRQKDVELVWTERRKSAALEMNRPSIVEASKAKGGEEKAEGGDEKAEGGDGNEELLIPTEGRVSFLVRPKSAQQAEEIEEEEKVESLPKHETLNETEPAEKEEKSKEDTSVETGFSDSTPDTNDKTDNKSDKTESNTIEEALPENISNTSDVKNVEHMGSTASNQTDTPDENDKIES